MIELKITFFDKDFKYAFCDEFDTKRIDGLKKLNKVVFERIFEQYKTNGIMSILTKFPKGWKHYNDYIKEYKKFMTGKIKENDRRIKKGEILMKEKEMRKGIPIFKSKLTEKDIRIILVGKNCMVKLFRFEDFTVKKFNKTIKEL